MSFEIQIRILRNRASKLVECDKTDVLGGLVVKVHFVVSVFDLLFLNNQVKRTVMDQNYTVSMTANGKQTISSWQVSSSVLFVTSTWILLLFLFFPRIELSFIFPLGDLEFLKTTETQWAISYNNKSNFTYKISIKF